MIPEGSSRPFVVPARVPLPPLGLTVNPGISRGRMYRHAHGYASASTVIYDDLHAYVWYVGVLELDITRANLGESSSIFSNAKIALSVPPGTTLDTGTPYRIGNLFDLDTPWYEFWPIKVRANIERSYDGETLMGRLARFQPTFRGSERLLRRAPPRDSGERWWYPEEALELILTEFQLEFPWLSWKRPLPQMGFRVAPSEGTLYRPHLQAISLVNELEAGQYSRRSLQEWLDEFFAVFDGYIFRANGRGELEVIAPHWATRTPPALVLTNWDLATEESKLTDEFSLVNECLVRSQAYGFIGDDDVLVPSAYRIKPDFFPNGDAPRADLVGDYVDLGEQLPRPETATEGLNTFIRPGTATFTVDVDPSVILPPGADQRITIDIELDIYRRRTGLFAGTDYAGRRTAAKPLILDGTEQLLENLGGAWGAGLMLSTTVFEIYGRFDAAENKVHIRVNHSLSHDAWFVAAVAQWQFAVILRITGTGLRWQRSNTAETGLARDQVSINQRGLLRREIDTGIFQLAPSRVEILPGSGILPQMNVIPSDASRIAGAVLANNAVPRELLEITLLPPYRLTPDHLGQLIELPGGSRGILINADYQEAHDPARIITQMVVTLELQERSNMPTVSTAPASIEVEFYRGDIGGLAFYISQDFSGINPRMAIRQGNNPFYANGMPLELTVGNGLQSSRVLAEDVPERPAGSHDGWWTKIVIQPTITQREAMADQTGLWADVAYDLGEGDLTVLRLEPFRIINDATR
jgi:hypothetical protein